MPAAMLETLTPIRVRYAETDAMGIVHHAVYPVWMELGRSEFLRAQGQGYSEWEAQGIFMSVGELKVRYRSPARYDELEVLSARYSVRLAKSDRDLVAPLSEAFRLHSPLARVTGRTSGEPVIQMQFTSTSGEPNLLGQDPLLPDARISVSPRSNWLEVQVGQ